jgi:hypothetical protein
MASITQARQRASTSASALVSRVRISEVFQSLTGVEPRRSGTGIARAPAVYRGGDGLSVSMDDSRGVWHDFKTDEGGGVLDLIVRVRGGTRRDALRWLADYVRTPLTEGSLSPAERQRWAEHRREQARELPQARHWRRTAVALGEELLGALKIAFFDPSNTLRVTSSDLRDITRTLERLRRLNGAELVAEFHWWVQHEPQSTAAMVRWARIRAEAERRAILRYLGFSPGDEL